MRPTVAAALLPALLLCAPAWAQESPPLPPYVPPATSAPLAPLVPDTASDGPLGDVKLKSDRASNIGAANTRSLIAPALPEPGTADDTVPGLLAAARTAVQAGRTGEAQEALERAESRVLSRDVAVADNTTAIADATVSQINAARQALSVGNTQAAITAIDAAGR